MNCTEQIQAFENWLKLNDLTPMSQLLWYKLLALSNEDKSEEGISIRNCNLMELMHIKREATFVIARDNLIQNGLIKFEKGKKGKINCYQICKFEITQQLEELELSKIKKNDAIKCNELIVLHTNDIDLKTALNEYLYMRDSKKKPPTIHAMQLVLNKLSKHDTETQIIMINNSIINGWTDIYEIKQKGNNFTKVNNNTYKMHNYTDDELNCFSKY